MHHIRQRGAPLQALQNRAVLSRETSALEPLHAFLRQRREAHAPVAPRDAVEQARPRRFVAAARAAWRHALARCDLDGPGVAVDGERYHPVLRGATPST